MGNIITITPLENAYTLRYNDTVHYYAFNSLLPYYNSKGDELLITDKQGREFYLKMLLGVDTISIDGVTVFADLMELFNAFKTATFRV